MLPSVNEIICPNNLRGKLYEEAQDILEKHIFPTVERGIGLINDFTIEDAGKKVNEAAQTTFDLAYSAGHKIYEAGNWTYKTGSWLCDGGKTIWNGAGVFPGCQQAIVVLGLLFGFIWLRRAYHIEIRPQPVIVNNNLPSNSSTSSISEDKQKYLEELRSVAFNVKGSSNFSNLVWVPEISEFVDKGDLQKIQSRYPDCRNLSSNP